LPTIEDIFNYVILLKQQLAQKDQMIHSLQNQLKELQEEKKNLEKFEKKKMEELHKLNTEGKK